MWVSNFIKFSVVIFYNWLETIFLTERRKLVRQGHNFSHDHILSGVIFHVERVNDMVLEIELLDFLNLFKSLVLQFHYTIFLNVSVILNRCFHQIPFQRYAFSCWTLCATSQQKHSQHHHRNQEKHLQWRTVFIVVHSDKGRLKFLRFLVVLILNKCL